LPAILSRGLQRGATLNFRWDRREVRDELDFGGRQVNSADGLAVLAWGVSTGSVGTAEWFRNKSPARTNPASKSGYKQQSGEG